MFVFIAGRDTHFRPIVHLNAGKVSEAIKQGISLESMYGYGLILLEQVLHYMFLPGQIENYTIVVDLQKKNLADMPIMVISC
jgi:hypothetical protein